MSSLVNWNADSQPVGSAIGLRRRLGKAQIDDLDLVAALLVEADRRADQRGDLIDLFLAARLIGDLALVVLGVAAVDQHGDRDAVDPAAFGHFGLGGLGNLVIDDFFGLLALLARAARWLPAGLALCRRRGISLPTVTWLSWLALVAEVSSRVWLERTTRPSGSIFVRGLGDAVEIEIGGDLNPRVAGADHRRDDALDLRCAAAFRMPTCRSSELTSPPLGSSAAPSARSCRFRRRSETRSGRRPLTAVATRWRMARTCCGSSVPRTLQYDRGRRLDLVAREQRPFRHHQVHARVLHAVERADGARELAFERAHAVDVLHEARGAERIRLVENLVADAAALGQPALGKRHAQLARRGPWAP